MRNMSIRMMMMMMISLQKLVARIKQQDHTFYPGITAPHIKRLYNDFWYLSYLLLHLLLATFTSHFQKLLLQRPLVTVLYNTD